MEFAGVESRGPADCPDETTRLIPTGVNQCENKAPIINRPPNKPGHALGPCVQFLTTDLEQMRWLGSVLIFRHVSFERPDVQFSCEANVTHDWEVLYDNIFDMRAYRINLSVELRADLGDEKVAWKVNWFDRVTEGVFYIARHGQVWRGAAFSCNGYDASIPRKEATGLNYDSVWNQLLSVHEATPLHVAIWGGDQCYNDFVLEDVMFLKQWTRMHWKERWTAEVPEQARGEIEEYYFNTYYEHWECRPEMKRALSSIPSVMMWDDHDIFDGARSYPPLFNESPVLLTLMEVAQKMRLLFQHHTTADKARQHGLFGHQGYNYLARCGPDLAILGADQRTERTSTIIEDERTWDLIFDRLNNELHGVKHLIAIFPVPFSYVRFHLGESIFGVAKKFSPLYRWIPCLNKTNSIFGLPELYDDLHDEWTHSKHLGERNRVLGRFQQLAQSTRIRTTFFSGDVHCCGVSRFRTASDTRPHPLHDTKLMYQIVSSAIVNKPPPRILIRALHMFARVWRPVDDTEEAVMDFFDRFPEDGSELVLQKFLPNRNWCYFEQSNVDERKFERAKERFGPWQDLWKSICSSLPWSTPGVNTELEPPEAFAKADDDVHANNLVVRFWLESGDDENDERKFANYDLLIPYLK